MLLPKYIVIFCCCLRQKVHKLIVFVEMWFQRLSWGNQLSRFRISYCQQYLVNFCCCLRQKVNKLILFVEMCFQRLSREIEYIDSEYESVNNIQ